MQLYEPKVLSKQLLKFSKHCKDLACERGISDNAVLEAVSEPTFSFYDSNSATSLVFKKNNGKYLLVLFELEENEVKVLTTFMISNFRKIIDRNLKNNRWVRIE